MSLWVEGKQIPVIVDLQAMTAEERFIQRGHPRGRGNESNGGSFLLVYLNLYYFETKAN